VPLHDIGRIQTSECTRGHHSVWTVFLHPPNGPDLALSDCQMFGHPKKKNTCDSIITPVLRHCRTPCTCSRGRRATDIVHCLYMGHVLGPEEMDDNCRKNVCVEE